MQQFQQRVVNEKAELDLKIDKLAKFFSTDTYLELDGEEKSRLNFQFVHMSDYSRVLRDRIDAFHLDAPVAQG